MKLIDALEELDDVQDVSATPASTIGRRGDAGVGY